MLDRVTHKNGEGIVVNFGKTVIEGGRVIDPLPAGLVVCMWHETSFSFVPIKRVGAIFFANEILGSTLGDIFSFVAGDITTSFAVVDVFLGESSIEVIALHM